MVAEHMSQLDTEPGRSGSRTPDDQVKVQPPDESEQHQQQQQQQQSLDDENDGHDDLADWTTDTDRTMVAGEYEFCGRDKLGAGAFGTVYRGKHSTSGQDVALKLVPNQRLKATELEAMAAAQSPCVIRLIDLVVTDLVTFIITELCDTDLGRFLDTLSGDPLSDENLRVVGNGLADGYAVLYRCGIVHRDIKPPNILLRVTDVAKRPEMFAQQGVIITVKYTDFGSCRRINDHGPDDRPRNLAGTFFYMAPEVGANCVDNRCYDASADMWSIGVVLFQCLTGRRPFDERQLCRLFLRAVDGSAGGYEPPTPERGPSPYPTVVTELLRFDPATRIKPNQLRLRLLADDSVVRHPTLSKCSASATNAARPSSFDSLPNLRRAATTLFGVLFGAMCGRRTAETAV